jgi:hypothetical protein
MSGSVVCIYGVMRLAFLLMTLQLILIDFLVVVLVAYRSLHIISGSVFETVVTYRLETKNKRLI